MDRMLPSDSQLIALYLSGQESAFAQLLERHRSRVFTTILLIVRDEDLAEDLLQDTFIKAIHTLKGGRYNEENKFGPWICRIAHNMAIDAYRRHKARPHDSIDDNAPLLNSLSITDENPDDLLAREETYARLRELIEELPAPQKEVLLMRHFGDMTFQEIADATGVSINTALGRMRYALVNLRKKIAANSRLYDTNLTLFDPPAVRLQRIAS
ncbi:sigma-70 family RNA polymerase sigma factor [Hymenobacter sp. ASUV-10]|uniref:Sigma-70 family RNA polymerase sigma factor n=1 Tax=Hymenobacter aranciens TaxID=3063996 RepID=A0ABT9BGS1_9BACT|nr:sigma-70 family RNA polymerase sigma factor [Hymenobacter sp. ASUV-10]MDO7876863.1 sigma-70 family RNA polymerase sigma factor [Hymenobacter sp. ASUV-10]